MIVDQREVSVLRLLVHIPAHVLPVTSSQEQMNVTTSTNVMIKVSSYRYYIYGETVVNFWLFAYTTFRLAKRKGRYIL